MKPSQNDFFAIIALLLCACVVGLALPASTKQRRSVGVPSGDNSQLSHLVKLIGKLKSFETGDSSEDASEWGTSSDDSELSDGSRLSASPAGRLAALKQGFLGLNKRGHGWSYDYGLGGGRFGKRNYGDYGIGGGRFGRDVDHVDVGDPSEAVL